MNLLSYEVRIYSLRRREGRKTKEKENRRVKVARGKSKRKQLQPKKKLALSLPRRLHTSSLYIMRRSTSFSLDLIEKNG